MRLTTASYLFAFALLLGGVSVTESVAKDSPQVGLPTLQIKVGSVGVKAELATTDETRQKGLMYREKLGKNEGMLFVFAELGYHSMWMRNTPLPLAVAYIDAAGKIVSIHEMEPKTEIAHVAAGPVRYALEMNGQWFAQNKIKVGDAVKGLERAPKPK